jgi:hypothetical protein
MRPSRRRLLLGGLTFGALPLAHTVQALTLAPGLKATQDLLAEWDGLGWQWTGTDAEHASAEWFARKLSETGLDVAIERYPFPRVDVAHCTLEIGEHRTPGLPLFDGGSTDAKGVSGPLANAGEDGAIAVLEAAPWEPFPQALETARSDARYRAVIVITRAELAGLAPLDCRSPLSTKPQGKPVIEVASEAAEWIRAGIAQGASAQVIARFERAPGEGRNVVSIWSGTNRSLPPIVVLAGRSGWGPCVGERGGGLIAMILAARALAQIAATRTVILAALSGCELGNMGEAALLARYPKLPAEAAGWIELGANLGARDRALVVSGRNRPWVELCEAHLKIEEVHHTAFSPDDATAAQGDAPTPSPQPVRPEDGVRSLALRAPATLAYHLPQDQLPSAVDLGQTLAVAKAFAATLLELAQA